MNFVNEVKDSYDLAENWFLNNQKENGIFYYIYEPKTRLYPDKNNAIRQLMASRLLAELASEDSSLEERHKRNLDFIFKHWYREENDVGYIYLYDKSKLGANAMALRALVYSPFFGEFRNEAENLARGIISLMNENGSFFPWYVEPEYGYDQERLLTFYSGEALLALVEYYKKTDDGIYLEAAIRGQEFYLGRYVEELKYNYYPAYVPWHTLSLYELYDVTGDAKYAEAVFILNDELLKIQDTENFVGRFYSDEYPEYGTPHSASDGVYTEGLAYAHELSRRLGDREHEKKYKKALRLAVSNLISLQYEDVEDDGDILRLKGAFRYRNTDSRIRIDTTQHTMDAYRKILEDFFGKM